MKAQEIKGVRLSITSKGNKKIIGWSCVRFMINYRSKVLHI